MDTYAHNYVVIFFGGTRRYLDNIGPLQHDMTWGGRDLRYLRNFVWTYVDFRT